MSNERFDFQAETLKKTDFKLLYVSISKYEGDWQSLPHTHHFTELFYVIRGEGNFLVENQTSRVQENDLVIVNPHVEHTEMSLDSQPMEYIVFGVEGIVFDFRSRDLAKNYGFFSYLGDKRQLLDFTQIMLKEITEKQPGYEVVCHSILEVLLVYITRNYRLGVASSPASKMTRECAIAKRYLDSNYAQNITLDSLAQVTHINKYYLAHLFSSHLGISPINYLTRKRLQVSMDLLTSTNHSMAGIASSTGFSSQSYFSQTFKKYTGLTPLQYRRLNSHVTRP